MNAPGLNSRLPPLWPRVAGVVGLMLAAVLALTGWAAAHIIAMQADHGEAARLSAMASHTVYGLRDRLDIADGWIRSLVPTDGSVDESELRRRVLASGAFSGLVVIPWNKVLAAVPSINAGDQVALNAGRSTLEVQPEAQGDAILYLAHAIDLHGQRQIGLFQLSPGWLWQDVDEVAPTVAAAIFDSRGVSLYRGTQLPAGVPAMFLRSLQDVRHTGNTVRQGWQQGGAAWNAAVAQLPLDITAVANDGSWAIAFYGHAADTFPAMQALAPALLAGLLLAALAVILVGAHVVRRWQPALMRLQTALQALREGAYQRVDLEDAPPVLRALGAGYNRAIDQLQQRLATQACLAEIDRLLLEANEFEQALEGILLRVRNLTGSQVVAVALIDRDAPLHARSFILGPDGEERPVSRVNIDGELTQQLQQATQEVTVPSHHLERYSFLEPLQEQGAGNCCVWSIRVGDRLAAILAVGYRDPAPPAREQLALGAECAARLRFALSNAERGEHLYRQAHFDSLTALPNRVLFRDRLAEELRHATDTGNRCALLYVDLDHFKKVNDSVGHVAGDQLLTIVAQRLRSCVKDSDTVARLGGDEFTVILRDVPSAENAGAIAARIIQALQRPVNIAGRDHYIRASIGITVFPDDADSIDAIMRNADLAMYQAKDAGRARAVYFDSKIARTHSRIGQSGLFRALRRREFALHYQPQFELRGGELVGVEALVRWPSPREGMRFPKDFLPAAEESGMIVELGAWVLESACQQFALWRAEGIAPARLALNVSMQQLRQADFPQLVQSNLAQAGLAPQALELDFTESALAEESACQALRALATLGVRLALDDFGTGYSSLTYLRAHPIDALKIDGSFMQEVPHNAEACLLADSIIDMAHGLAKLVIAEGVETLAQLHFLREHGCDLAQGFVLARPLGVEEVSELLASQRVLTLATLSEVG